MLIFYFYYLYFYLLCIINRFRDSDNALLITSDVAARGLDIPAVDHVIHYQLPRSADVNLLLLLLLLLLL